MSRKTLIAGNWKMNKTVPEALALVAELKAQSASMAGVEVVLCPPFTALAPVASAAAGTPMHVGAQNVHWESAGAYTGEISADMLCEIPVEYVIIGHSERRQYFAETDATVNSRLNAALAAGLVPIVCVGETLSQRQGDETAAVITSQVRDSLAGLDAGQMQRTVVAYEPVWAIGTGLTASPEQAQEVHALIRGLLRDMFGDVAESVRILYGGSVKPGNTKTLMAGADIDGALVGGASLSASDFCGIIANAR